MIGLLTIMTAFAIAGVKSWNKNKNINVKELYYLHTPSEKEEETMRKKTDLVSFLRDVDNCEINIPQLIETKDWFDCEGVKISVENEGNTTNVNLHLPNYTLRENKAKIAEFMRATAEWRKKLNGYNFKRSVELRITVTKDDDTKVYVVPEKITSAFADDRDPSGANRLYEALMLNRSQDHDRAVDAIGEVLGQDEFDATAECIIKMSFNNIDNEDLASILKTPIQVIDREGNQLLVENILFSSEPGYYFDFNEEGEIDDYVVEAV